MVEKYYCGQCKAFVSPVMGEFEHPHLGWRATYVCPTCNHMVYLKVKDEVIPA